MRRAFADPARVTVGDAVLAMVDQGSGPPVVLVHGGLSDLRIWEGQATALARQFRVIAYSRRYAWPNASIDPAAPDPVEAHVADLAALIRSRGRGGGMHVVGHSWGGLIALLAAIRHRGSVKSLVLMEPPALTLLTPIPPGPSALLRLMATRPRAALAVLRFVATGLVPARAAFRRGDDRAALRAFGRAVLGRDYFADLSAARLEQIWANRGPERAQALYGAFPDIDADEVAALDLPVLLVGGEDSPRLFGVTLDRIAELLPKAQRRTVNVASHVMQLDNPAATSAAITAFLASVV